MINYSFFFPYEAVYDPAGDTLAFNHIYLCRYYICL